MIAFIKHTTVKHPPGAIFTTAGDEGAPFMRINDGVDSHDKFGQLETIKGQYGKLDNLIDPAFPELDGNQQNLYGTYIENGFFKGTLAAGTVDAGAVQVDDLQALSANTGSLTVTDKIQSSNYLEGSAGFRLGSDGSAELNDVSLRGGLRVTDEIRSSNYTAGEDGFLLTSAGDAEFNNGVFRGTLNDLSVDGDIELTGNGQITNAARDFTLDDTGLSLTPSTANTPTASINWAYNHFIGGYLTAGVEVISYRAQQHEFLGDNGARIATFFRGGQLTLEGSLRVGTFSDSQRDSQLNPSPGEVIYNTDAGTLQVWTGSGWRNL